MIDPNITLQTLVKEILQESGLHLDFQTIRAQPLLDRALGCMFGSIIGDALGSYVEFEPKISQQRMEVVMEMPGGGTFDTLSGQGTDDSEMALCLLHSLLLYQPGFPLSQQSLSLELAIAHSYIGWFRSSPFDIGKTIRNGLGIVANCLQPMSKNQLSLKQAQKLLFLAYEKVNIENSTSVSNGYLMRNHPLAIFKAFLIRHKMEESMQLEDLIRGEISMTHSHPLCIESGMEFIEVLAALISRKNFALVRKVYEMSGQKKDEMWQWKQEVREKKALDLEGKPSGWAKIAYILAFKKLKEISQTYEHEQLLKPELFSKIMREVIQLGGDTDTNAAIVGAMVGSILGFSKLPQKYLLKTLLVRMPKEEFEKKPRRSTARMPFFQPRNALVNIVKMGQKFREADTN